MNPRQRVLGGLACLVVISVFTSLAARVALTTRFDAHPDEYWHAYAFHYFEQHVWPPPLNAPDLEYDLSGTNRVYYGEVVYLVFGRVAAGLHALGLGLEEPAKAADPVGPAGPAGPFRLYFPVISRLKVLPVLPPLSRVTPLYRLLNTALLLGMLLVVAYVGRRRPVVLALGLTLLCLPQAVYLYAYANADGWGLSVILLLFSVALTQRRVLASYPRQMVIGLLVGLVFLSKSPYWLSLPFTGLVLAHQAWRDEPGRPWREAWPAVVRAVVVVAAVAGAVSAPLRLIYPLSQRDYAAKEAAMREAHAAEGFKPSHLTYPGFHLAARGQPFSVVLGDRGWFGSTARSFYGLFGYMSIRLTDWVYTVALGLGLLNLGLTLYFAFRPGSSGAGADRWLLLGAVGTVGLCVAASLYNSWTYDAQPQGRYLFGALPALALLVWGQFSREPRWAQWLRLGSAALLLAESACVLVHYLVLNPTLQV